MNTFTSLLVFGLSFVPGLNRLPFVRNFGSLDAAVKFLGKAAQAVAVAAANAERDVKQLETVLQNAAAQKAAREAEAERAKRVASRFEDLLS